MAKRPRLTTQDVLYAIDSSDDEDFEVDEPFTDGSDDEFEDLNGEEDDDNMDVSPPYSPQGTLPGASPDSSPDSSPASTPTSLPHMWTTSLQPVTVRFILLLVPLFQFQNHHWKYFTCFLPRL